MGLIVSRFRKSNTKDQLESIEKDIRNINDYRIHTQQRQKQFLGSLVAVSVVIYVCFAIIFYLYYFPSEFGQQVVYSLPLVVFPLIVWAIRRFMIWFFQRRLRKNDLRLTELLRRKRKILEDVMETETYKVARELLEKFDPDQFRKQTSSKDDVASAVSDPGVRQRQNATRSFPGSSPNLKSQVSMAAGRSSGSAGFSRVSIGSVQQGMPGMRPPGPPLPRPILPRERTFMERLIEYLVGDGPNTRFALICRQCNSHNGMAMKEEFEYIAFRCCYCYFWNAARKQRPSAPRLPEHQLIQPTLSQEMLDTRSKSDLPEVLEEGERESDSQSEEKVPTEELTDGEIIADDEEEEIMNLTGEEEEEAGELLENEDSAMQIEFDPLNPANSKSTIVSKNDPERVIELQTGNESVDQIEKDEQPKSEMGEGDQPQYRLAEVEK